MGASEPFDRAARTVLTDVVRKAARNTGSSIADFLRRPKSQAYLFGQLSKRFPDATETERREVIRLLTEQLLSAPDAEAVVDPRPTRPPSRGREPMMDPKWEGRLKLLIQLIDVPLTTHELRARAMRELGWSPNFFSAAIAAAEGRGVLEYQPPHWMPVPQAETRRMPKHSRVKIRKLERELDCLLSDAEKLKLQDTIRDIATRRGLAIGKLDEKERAIRARHREELKQECGPEREALARISRERNELDQFLVSGAMRRPVQCEERFDYETGTVSIVRLDTHDVIDRRAMTTEERQLELDHT